MQCVCYMLESKKHVCKGTLEGGMNMRKRFLSLAIILVMAIIWMPVTVMAEGDASTPVIPMVTINGNDRVCRTQDYTFSFTLPTGVENPSVGYEFSKMGSDVELKKQGEVCTGVVRSSWYCADETSFKVVIYANVNNANTTVAEKTITIQNEHSGGYASCIEKAECEVCGQLYGDVDPYVHTQLQLVEAKEATADTEGNIEYWYCTGCQKCYLDEGTEKRN